jgi:CPA2 family monovalent cation:H+ antiporter-2
MQDLLVTVLLLLAACSLAALAAGALKVPTLLGYLAVGALLGPSASALIQPGPALSLLSELGVALLLFMVGLEFSLSHFWLNRRAVLVAGALQMAIVATPVGLVLVGLGWAASHAALLGAAAAMSSTALVSRQLADQGELTTRHGRSAIAVLVFQDLASVPLLALLAIGARGESPLVTSVVLEVAAVLCLFAVSAILSRRFLHGLLVWVARQGQEEPFILVSLGVVVASATAAHAVGVSAALGAFLAGMVLGESDVRHHMENHLKPFRDVLSGLFFVTIGLQLDLDQLLAAPLAVSSWLLALLFVKVVLNFVALRASQQSRLDAWRTAIVLGHGGEFALLLLGMALQQGLMSPHLVQPMLMALVMSMAAAPLLIRHHDRLALALSRSAQQPQPPQAEEGAIAVQVESLRDHVIICGAGESGLMVSQVLRSVGVAHVLLESDEHTVMVARRSGAPVCHGDASRIDTLEAAGLARACLLVLTFFQSRRVLRTVQAIQARRPQLPVIASCTSAADAHALQQWPNVRVYRESLAVGLGLAQAALLHMGRPSDEVDRCIGAMRLRLDRFDFEQQREFA